MNKVAILYICTGKYIAFWHDFYVTAERYLLPNCEKTYFVFTDSEHILEEGRPNVRKILQGNLGWPGNTLFRYQIFRRYEHLFHEFDYMFFFNANIVFLEAVYEGELLPRVEEGITVVSHPGFYDKDPSVCPYERNPRSAAYVPYGHGGYYCLGGVNGGRTAEYLQLVRTLDERIMQDHHNGMLAVYWDESHFNKYIMTRTVKMLTPSYGYAEGVSLPFTPKILIRDKNRWGGHQYLRS
jgi:hypothetical protein